jgi:hypothetical protein
VFEIRNSIFFLFVAFGELAQGAKSLALDAKVMIAISDIFSSI